VQFLFGTLKITVKRIWILASPLPSKMELEEKMIRKVNNNKKKKIKNKNVATGLLYCFLNDWSMLSLLDIYFFYISRQ